jgi:hypothetical protein
MRKEKGMEDLRRCRKGLAAEVAGSQGKVKTGSAGNDRPISSQHDI